MITSARSDGRLDTHQCDPSDGSTLRAMQGTSMAAPVAAANAILIREYLMKYVSATRCDVTCVHVCMLEAFNGFAIDSCCNIFIIIMLMVLYYHVCYCHNTSVLFMVIPPISSHSFLSSPTVFIALYDVTEATTPRALRQPPWVSSS